jgi:hypothetical protein
VIVAAYQPFFAPFPGFFAKALLADVLVLLDGVQFPQRTGWLTRNRFKCEQGELWLTIPVRRKGCGLQRIDEVRIVREGSWARKHLASFKECYGRAPFFADHLPFLEGLFSAVPERLLDLTLPILRHLAAHLGCRARIVLLSELGIEAREPVLSVEVCRKLGATAFLAQRPAGKFLSPELFSGAGVRLLTFAYHPEIYPQLYGPFIQNLSALDLLFCCGPKAPTVLQGWLRRPTAG